MRVLKYRVTYLPGGIRQTTFFGTKPAGKRLTLWIPPPRRCEYRGRGT
jgi:hypothetical protein